MSPFITEAAVVAAKEALKLAVVWYVLRGYLAGRGADGLIKPFLAGVLAASFFAFVSLFMPPNPGVKVFLGRLVGYVFFIFYLASVGALYQDSGEALVGNKRISGGALGPIVFLLTVFYFVPDIVGSSMYIRELSYMKGSMAPTYLSAAAGFAVSLAVLIVLFSKLKWNASRFFGLAQLLLFLSIIKLIAGGTRGFAELSLMPSVQRGVMKFVHDFVHQTFVFIMVPDHPLLRITTWNFIGFFFGSNFAIGVTLVLLLAPPMLFLARSVTTPLPLPATEGGVEPTGAERRLYRAEARADRARKAVPVFVFVLVILFTWFSGRGEELSRLYNPALKPVVEDKGVIVIPLTDPTMDLLDGRLHKFSFSTEGEVIRLLVLKKPQGEISVCLDACEVCPPDGYGQTEGNVVCIYCMTPIPEETLGQPGGCNPVPLEAAVTEKDIRISVDEIMKKWRMVSTGRGRGGTK